MVTGKDLQGHVLLQFVRASLGSREEGFLPRSGADYSFAKSAFSFTSQCSDTPGNHPRHTAEAETSYCRAEALFIHAEKEHQTEESLFGGPSVQTHLSISDSPCRG